MLLSLPMLFKTDMDVNFLPYMSTTHNVTWQSNHGNASMHECMASVCNAVLCGMHTQQPQIYDIEYERPIARMQASEHWPEGQGSL